MARVEYREEPARSALFRVQGIPLLEWSLNPYTGCVHRCTFCYVRGFERRAGRPSDDRYGQTVRVKVGIVEQLRRELARGRGAGGVVIGTATDPYQPVEGRYRLTRASIVELGAARTRIGIITRGPLIVRDVDVLQEASKYADIEVNVSIPTVDPHLWRSTEPGTAPPHQRMRAIRTLVDGGIRTTVALAPLLPGLSDTPESVHRVLEQAREAGACAAWMNLLNLRPGVREHFLEALARTHPEDVERYEQQYAKAAYLPRADQDAARKLVRDGVRQHGIADRRTNRIVPELQLSLL